MSSRPKDNLEACLRAAKNEGALRTAWHAADRATGLTRDQQDRLEQVLGSLLALIHELEADQAAHSVDIRAGVVE